MRLTQKLIEKTPRPATGQRILWDDLLVGFGCRLTPTKTSFVVQWREAGGRKPRFNVGQWPALSVEDAREFARKRLGEQVKLARSGASVSLARAMREWYEHQVRHGTWRPRYAAKVSQIIASYVEGTESERRPLAPALAAAVATLGSKSIGHVKRQHLTAVSDHVSRGAADQFLAIVSSFYGWAIERETVEANPARNRLRLTGGRRKRNRRLTDAEVAALWTAFAVEEDPALGAFELLLFTGARRREVTLMRWAEVDLKAATWTLPAARRKNGNKNPEPFVITLAPPALRVLKRQPRVEGNPYVFWGRRDSKAFDFQHLLMKRVHAAAKVEDWVLHDLRRYMRTGLGALGVSQVVAEMCLGHMAPKAGLVGVYDQHDYADEMKAAWLKWARYVEGIGRARAAA